MKRKTDNILLIDCLNTKYGIVATNLILLLLGADMNASVYKAETCNGQSYFVKLKQKSDQKIVLPQIVLVAPLFLAKTPLTFQAWRKFSALRDKAKMEWLSLSLADL